MSTARTHRFDRDGLRHVANLVAGKDGYISFGPALRIVVSTTSRFPEQPV